MKVLKPQNNRQLFSLNFDKVAVKSSSNWQLYVNFRTYTQIHTPTVVQGGTGGGGGWMVDGTPPRSFWYVALFWNDFTFDLNKMRYILKAVALLKVCDVINNGRHLGFYQELEIRQKPQETVIFRGFTWKITYRWAFCMILATRFTFIVEGSLRNMYFHPKLAWPPVAYNVLTRYHSNLPSLNLSQNVHEGWINSYWKRQVQTFYPLGENLEKPPCTSEG